MSDDRDETYRAAVAESVRMIALCEKDATAALRALVIATRTAQKHVRVARSLGELLKIPEPDLAVMPPVAAGVTRYTQKLSMLLPNKEKPNGPPTTLDR